MALEKSLFAVTPVLFAADGGQDGKVIVIDTSDFKVKQKVKVSGTALEQIDLEVKRITSNTEMYLGPVGGPISERANLSAYTVAAASFIYAIEQKRPSIPFEEYMRAMYDEEPTVAMRSILVDKYGNRNSYRYPLSVRLSDGEVNLETDSFGRLKTNNPTTIFDTQFHINKKPLFWDESITGTATSVFDATLHSIRINLGTASGNQVIRQTFRRFKNDPGKLTSLFGTFTLGQPKANVLREFGYYNENNGFFFRSDSSNISVVLRSSVSGALVDTQINQVDWNVDRMDGTGASGINIDFNKSVNFYIDWQGSGSGEVRFGFNINGSTRICHTMRLSNSTVGPYIQTTNLPLRILARNTGTTVSDTQVIHTCSTIAREGEERPEGDFRSVNNGTTSRVVGTGTILPVISIRTDTAVPHAILDLLRASIHMTGNTDVLYGIHINPTLTGANFVASPSGGYTLFDVSATAVTSIGTVVHSGYFSTSIGPQITFDITVLEKINNMIGVNIAGTDSTIITLSAVSLSGNIGVVGSFTYREAS